MAMVKRQRQKIWRNHTKPQDTRVFPFLFLFTSHGLIRLVEQGHTVKTRATRLTCAPTLGDGQQNQPQNELTTSKDNENDPWLKP